MVTADPARSGRRGARDSAGRRRVRRRDGQPPRARPGRRARSGRCSRRASRSSASASACSCSPGTAPSTARTQGLGWFDASVVRFNGRTRGLKVPHMGWNEVRREVRSSARSRRSARASSSSTSCTAFTCVCHDPADVACTCEYGGRFTAAIAPRQHLRDPVPPGEEPGQRDPAADEFRPLESVDRAPGAEEAHHPEVPAARRPAVQGVRFHENLREAGNPVTTAKVYDAYGVDELIFLDIEATEREPAPPWPTSSSGCRRTCSCRSPSAAASRALEDVNGLLRAGADKVVGEHRRGREARSSSAQAAQAFGDQCITVSIDYREDRCRRAAASSRTAAGRRPASIRSSGRCGCRTRNCGEVLLCSIDRDGTMSGYDLDMIARASELLDVPLIASSGAGSLQHCIDAFGAGASAIAIGSLFLFTDHSPIKVRTHLWSQRHRRPRQHQQPQLATVRCVRSCQPSP